MGKSAPSVSFGTVYSILILLLLTCLVILLKNKWGNLPKTSHDLLHELGHDGTVSYQNTWRNLVLALGHFGFALELVLQHHF